MHSVLSIVFTFFFAFLNSSTPVTADRYFAAIEIADGCVVSALVVEEPLTYRSNDEFVKWKNLHDGGDLLLPLSLYRLTQVSEKTAQDYIAADSNLSASTIALEAAKADWLINDYSDFCGQ